MNHAASRPLLRVRIWLFSAAIVASSLGGSLLAAQEYKAPPALPKPTWASLKHVEYNHGACVKGASITSPGCSARFRKTLGDGEEFAIVILDSDTAHFNYSLEAIVREVSKTQNVEGGADTSPHDTVTLYRQHDKKYGGYIVHIVAKPDAKNVARGDATVTVEVVTRSWELEFGGGFTVSGLSDRAYAVKADTVVDTATNARTGVLRIERQRANEDQQRLGLGSFVHVYRTDASWFGVTFGLGLEQNRAASYYFGPSFRLGGKATVTTGLLWGSVKTLPPGFSENQIVTDANVISTLGSRTERSWFVGISYSFIGGAEKALGKPFADAPAQQAPDNKPATTTESQVDVTADQVETRIKIGETLEAVFGVKPSGAKPFKLRFKVTDEASGNLATGITFIPDGGKDGLSGNVVPDVVKAKASVKLTFASTGTYLIQPQVDENDVADDKSRMRVIVSEAADH